MTPHRSWKKRRKRRIPVWRNCYNGGKRRFRSTAFDYAGKILIDQVAGLVSFFKEGDVYSALSVIQLDTRLQNLRSGTLGVVLPVELVHLLSIYFHKKLIGAHVNDDLMEFAEHALQQASLGIFENHPNLAKIAKKLVRNNKPQSIPERHRRRVRQIRRRFSLLELFRDCFSPLQ